MVMSELIELQQKRKELKKQRDELVLRKSHERDQKQAIDKEQGEIEKLQDEIDELNGVKEPISEEEQSIKDLFEKVIKDIDKDIPWWIKHPDRTFPTHPQYEQWWKPQEPTCDDSNRFSILPLLRRVHYG